jgi:hypothetical protein
VLAFALIYETKLDFLLLKGLSIVFNHPYFVVRVVNHDIIVLLIVLYLWFGFSEALLELIFFRENPITKFGERIRLIFFGAEFIID